MESMNLPTASVRTTWKAGWIIRMRPASLGVIAPMLWKYSDRKNEMLHDDA